MEPYILKLIIRGKFTDDNTSCYRGCLSCFVLLSNDLKDDSEDQDIYNMEGFFGFSRFRGLCIC